MIDQIALNTRTGKGEELTWNEVDVNWQRLVAAINGLVALFFYQEYTVEAAGELVVTHNKNQAPMQVVVWQKVLGDRWIPIATPDVYYKEVDFETKVYIKFSDAPGMIKVIIKF